jgi:hypothetical protein
MAFAIVRRAAGTAAKAREQVVRLLGPKRSETRLFFAQRTSRGPVIRPRVDPLDQGSNFLIARSKGRRRS